MLMAIAFIACNGSKTTENHISTSEKDENFLEVTDDQFQSSNMKLGDLQLLSFFGVTLLTMFIVDIFKIYFSSRLKEKLDNKVLSIIGILIGGLMIFFGVAICLKDIQL